MMLWVFIFNGHRRRHHHGSHLINDVPVLLTTGFLTNGRHVAACKVFPGDQPCFSSNVEKSGLTSVLRLVDSLHD